MDKFIQIRGYLHEINNENVLKIFSDEGLEKDRDYNILLFSHSKDDKGFRIVELHHCLLDLISTCFANRTFNLKEYGSQITEEGLHVKEVQFLKILGNFLGYLNNCTSFRNHNGTFEEFDKIELNNRLEKVKEFFK